MDADILVLEDCVHRGIHETPYARLESNVYTLHCCSTEVFGGAPPPTTFPHISLHVTTIQITPLPSQRTCPGCGCQSLQLVQIYSLPSHIAQIGGEKCCSTVCHRPQVYVVQTQLLQVHTLLATQAAQMYTLPTYIANQYPFRGTLRACKGRIMARASCRIFRAGRMFVLSTISAHARHTQHQTHTR